MAGINLYLALAILFWITAALMIAPSVRRRLTRLLVLPGATNQSHLASLDAFRGIAALFVAIFHTSEWSNPAFKSTLDWAPVITRGDKAVPIFVILSGLLIYRSLMRAETIEDLRRYVRRRFLRIFPVYLSVVVVTLILIHSFSINIPLLQYFLAEAFMLRSLGFPVFVTPQVWSLYVEILFYAVAPLFVLVASRRPILYALLALIIFSLADVIGPRELGLWKYFCFGIIAAELIERVRLGPISATLVALCGMAIVTHDLGGGADWIALGIMKISADTVRITGGHPSYTLMLGVGVTVLLVGAVKAPAFRWVMESFPLRALGAVSYSLFMWHGLLVVANFPVSFNGEGAPIPLGPMPLLPAWYMPAIVIPGMIALASLSFVLIERPFLLMRSKTVAPKAIADLAGATSKLRPRPTAARPLAGEPSA